MNETWKDVVGYEGLYRVSDKGNVKSVLLNKLMLGSKSKGYRAIGLTKNMERKMYKVHRLVAICFMGTCDGKPNVNHKNGIKDDNRLENLEWCTQLENVRHAIKTGLMPRKTFASGENHAKAKLTNRKVVAIKVWLKLGFQAKQIASAYSVNASTVGRIYRKETWKNI